MPGCEKTNNARNGCVSFCSSPIERSLQQLQPIAVCGRAEIRDKPSSSHSSNGFVREMSSAVTMIVELFFVLLAATLVSLFGYLLVLGAENRQKYKFFEKNAPGLKVLENPSLFGGHANQIVHVKHNWARGFELLEKYGSTLGFYYDSRPAVLTVDLDFIKTFTVDEQVHTNRIKAGIPFSEIEEDCIMFAEDEQWLRIRKAIAPAFSAHRVKMQNVQADINGVIEKLVGLIELQLNEAKESRHEDSIEVDLDYLCHRYALALVFTNFYKQDRMISFDSAEDQYVTLMEKNLQEFKGWPMQACAAFPFLKAPLNWLILNFHGQGKMRNAIMSDIRKLTKLHFEAAEQSQRKQTTQGQFDQLDSFTLNDGSKFRRNMIDYVADQYREGKLTRSEYFNSTFFLFLAADKTTADCLARLLYQLARQPAIQEKLRRSILASGTDSEYLAWCIHESLRLDPPVPSGCSRVIKRDIETRHGLVPAGTFVVTPAYFIGRLKEYWGDDAEQYRPERWADAKNFHPVQYLAFGGGRRACPGKELALMEIKMLLNVLLRKYKFEKPLIRTEDNSKLFTAPVFAFLAYDIPAYVRISRL